MAWPVDAVFEVITAGVTTAKKTLADALQNAIIGIYGGGKTVKALTVDGTGNQDGSGTPAGQLLAQSVKASGAVTGKRLFSTSATAYDGSEVTLSSEWGGSPTALVATGSDDVAGSLLVSPGTTPSPSPTITIVFKDGDYANPPRALVVMNGSDYAADMELVTWVTTTHHLVITWPGTPTHSHKLNFSWFVIGR